MSLSCLLKLQLDSRLLLDEPQPIIRGFFILCFLGKLEDLILSNLQLSNDTERDQSNHS